MGKTLIVEFTGKEARAGVFGKSAEPEFVFSIPSTDVRAAALQVKEGLFSRGVRKVSMTVVGLPPSELRMRVIELPFDGRQKALDILPIETQDMFLMPPTGLAYGVVELAGMRKLAVAVDKATLRLYIEAFREAGLGPDGVGCSLFSKDRFLKGGALSGKTAFVDSSSFTAVLDGKPFMYKALGGAEDLSLAVAACEEDGQPITGFYSSRAGFELLKPLGKDPSVSSEYDEGSGGLIALNTGSRGAAFLNLMSGEFADREGEDGLKRRLRLTFALSAVFLALWAAYSGLRYSNLSAEASRTAAAAQNAYREAFPQDTKVADPVYQAEAKLKTLKKESSFLEGGADPAAVMSTLSKAAGGLNVRLLELHVSGGSFTALLEAPTYDKTGLFRDALESQGDYNDIKLIDASQSASGMVRFNVSASTGGI